MTVLKLGWRQRWSRWRMRSRLPHVNDVINTEALITRLIWPRGDASWCCCLLLETFGWPRTAAPTKQCLAGTVTRRRKNSSNVIHLVVYKAERLVISWSDLRGGGAYNRSLGEGTYSRGPFYEQMKNLHVNIKIRNAWKEGGARNIHYRIRTDKCKGRMTSSITSPSGGHGFYSYTCEVAVRRNLASWPCGVDLCLAWHGRVTSCEREKKKRRKHKLSNVTGR